MITLTRDERSKEVCIWAGQPDLIFERTDFGWGCAWWVYRARSGSCRPIEILHWMEIYRQYGILVAEKVRIEMNDTRDEVAFR
jgi:hypothetical protein